MYDYKKAPPHIRNYFEFFGYKIPEDVFCEVCAKQAGQVHHLVFRSKGRDDSVENCMALCSGNNSCHDKAHGKGMMQQHEREIYSEENLQNIHNKRIGFRNILK